MLTSSTYQDLLKCREALQATLETDPVYRALCNAAIRWRMANIADCSLEEPV